MIFRFDEENAWNLPEITNWEDYPYNASCQCDNCSYPKYEPNQSVKGIVGWCCTDAGMFVCFKCPQCGSKFRYHYNRDAHNPDRIEVWKEDVALALLLGDHDYDEYKLPVDEKDS